MTITSLDTGRAIIDALELVDPSYEIPTSKGKNLILTISSVYNRTVQIGDIKDLHLDYLLEICAVVKDGFANSHLMPGNKYLTICFQGNSVQSKRSRNLNALKIVNGLKNTDGVTQLLLDYKKGRNIPRCHLRQGNSSLVTDILYPKFHNSLSEIKEDLRDIEKELKYSEMHKSESEMSTYWKDKEPILSKVYNPERVYNKLDDEFYLRCWANRYRDQLFKHIYMDEFREQLI